MVGEDLTISIWLSAIYGQVTLYCLKTLYSKRFSSFIAIASTGAVYTTVLQSASSSCSYARPSSALGRPQARPPASIAHHPRLVLGASEVIGLGRSRCCPSKPFGRFPLAREDAVPLRPQQTRVANAPHHIPLVDARLTDCRP